MLPRSTVAPDGHLLAFTSGSLPLLVTSLRKSRRATIGVKKTVGGKRTGLAALWMAYAMLALPTFSDAALASRPNLLMI